MQALPASGADADTGMKMATEGVTVLNRLSIFHIMCENKIADGMLFIDHGDAGMVVPFIGKYIVVAADELYGQTGKIVAPAQEKIMLFIGMAVKHIADHDQLLRVELLYKGEQPLHIFLENALRHSNTRFAEMSRLTQMKIRKDQCFFFFPEQATVGGEL